MPDPNDLLAQIQMVCGDVAKSKTALGYDQNLMTKLGMVVFGNADALRDAIQAPDGKSYRSALFEAAESAERLRDALAPFAGEKMPSNRRTERAFNRHGLRCAMSPLQIARDRAATALEQ
jgi:hypothetical protein